MLQKTYSEAGAVPAPALPALTFWRITLAPVDTRTSPPDAAPQPGCIAPLCTALNLVAIGIAAGVRGLPPDQQHDFATWLIQRLLLLKWVEQRGWLDGNPNYLLMQFQQHPRNYWHRVLVPLLDVRSGAVERMPAAFLSAEVCTRPTAWDVRQVDLDAAVMPILFQQLLNRADFTPNICEFTASSLNFPDQLAYAYEKLLADRHGRGAYYSQPAEVAMMCRESLRSYLELRCPEVAPERVTALVYGETEMQTGLLSPADALVLYAALHQVTVCDPAAGTGIFLVAMLRQLAHLMQTLGKILVDDPRFRSAVARSIFTDPRHEFELKLHILEQSIYGCDIDPAAIQLARLRCWMELLATTDQPRPLPNLAWKLMVGEALGSAIGDATHERLREFITLKQRYFAAHTLEECHNQQAQLVQLRAQIVQECGGTPADCQIHWPIDTAALFQQEQPGFDIVIGNPPYLRQELVDISYAALGTPIRKQDLQHRYQALTGYRVSGTADLYVFFFLRGLLLLRQHGGTLCYLCSNAWLDVAYGEVIQQAIIDSTSTCTIFDTQAERSFDAAAAVNTTITLLQTGAHEPRAATFARFRAGFEQIGDWRALRQTDACTVITVAYADLAQAGGERGNWGGRYLRSPEIYRHLMERYRDRLVPLGSVATLRFGIKTGANPFFHLSRETIATWGIEPHFLRPLLRHTRECRSIFVDPDRLTYHLLVCNQPPAALAGTRVLDYIGWGEQMQFDQRPSCRVRVRWYALGVQPPADFISLRFRDMRNWSPLLAWTDRDTVDVAVGDTVFVGRFHDRRFVGVGGALLNSTLFVLMSEVYGRANLGEGLLTTYGPEMLKLPLVDPHAALECAAELLAALQQLAQRETRSILEEIHQADRHTLDEIVFTLMGLTSAERDAVYQAVQDLVETRIHKAQQTRTLV